jgi:hypothetical protein
MAMHGQVADAGAIAPPSMQACARHPVEKENER